MKNKLYKIGITIGLFIGSVAIAYAASRLFFSQSIVSDFSKKQIFTFDLSAGLESAEIGPGDKLSISPKIENTATEEMYTFIEVKMPTVDNESIYEINPGEGWQLVKEENGVAVYAYADDVMTKLFPGFSTENLTDTLKMKNISNAKYYEIGDINIRITGYAVDVNNSSSSPELLWEEIEAIK